MLQQYQRYASVFQAMRLNGAGNSQCKRVPVLELWTVAAA